MTSQDSHLVIVDAVRAQRLTYLKRKRLVALAEACLEVERSETPGTIVEAGCALGGSAILMTHCKSPERTLEVYDVFGMIPPPGENDGDDVQARYAEITSGKSAGIGGDQYYGYVENLKQQVVDAFHAFGMPPADHNVRLIEGLLQQTLRVDQPVAVAHIDVDWYEPVRVCLERIVPMLADSGIILVDDYRDWSGCRRAVDDHFADCRDQYSFDLSNGSLMIRRAAN